MKYNKDNPSNPGYIKNMEVLAHHDLDNHYAFQTQLYKTKNGKYYLYCGCYFGTGVEILDVTDPNAPKTVQYFDVVDPEVNSYMATPKVQICDDIMIVSLGNCIEFLHGKPNGAYEPVEGGIKIYSLKKDPENPEFLSFWSTGTQDKADPGVHRFTYNGGRYIHLTANAKGYSGFIYRIIDIEDPYNPHEVGRWFLEGQFLGNQTAKDIEKNHYGWNAGSSYPGFVHHVYADGDRAYVSCAGQGFKILDISDVTFPKLIGEISMYPPCSEKFGGALCHTFMPIHGTKYAVGLEEGERFWIASDEMLKHFGKQGYRGIQIFDIEDPADIEMISIFPYPEVPEEWPWDNFNYCGQTVPGPFGPHNIHEPMTNKPGLEDRADRIYDCYFHAGVRVYDTTDPYIPKEIAYFIPPNPETLCYDLEMANPPLGTMEDIVVDDRGVIYANAMHDGLYILKVLS